MYSSRGHRGDAAAHVSGRRPQAARHLHQSAGAARRAAAARSASFPLFRFWGPAADIVSSRGSAAARCDVFERSRPDADAGVPAASGLQPAAPRARSSAHRAGRGRGRSGLRRADRGGTSAPARAWSCCRSTASRRCRIRCTSIARCARPARSRCARNSGASCSMPARRAPSPWPITRSRTSTWREPALVSAGQSAGRSAARRGARARRRRQARSAGWIIRAPANWSPSRGRTAGSPTTTFSTSARAGLRAHRRHPSQAGLRPGRAVHRPAAARSPRRASPGDWRRRCSASVT